MEWRGTPKWNENQSLLVLEIQGFDVLMQGFDFEIQGICSYINGNSKFWQSFDFGLEKNQNQNKTLTFKCYPYLKINLTSCLI